MKDIEKIEKLGTEIGYGHLIFLASALWRKSAIENNYPESGAFVGTLLPFIKKKYHKITKSSMNTYDEILNLREIKIKEQQLKIR
jgi:hypothetical protein